MFCYARQFADADTVVIAAPYWDLLFPAVLRIYLENITVCGITFRYSEKGIPESLCNAEKLCYVTTSGGFIGENNFGFDYVKALSSGFFGMWREGACAEKKDPYVQPFVMAKPKIRNHLFCNKFVIPYRV